MVPFRQTNSQDRYGISRTIHFSDQKGHLIDSIFEPGRVLSDSSIQYAPFFANLGRQALLSHLFIQSAAIRNKSVRMPLNGMCVGVNAIDSLVNLILFSG